jgi:hypothetical protein
MSKKKLTIVIIGYFIVLIALGIVAYRGTLIMQPEGDGSKILINGKTYQNFPIKIKLTPGKYSATVWREGYLTKDEEIKIKWFKKITYKPLLYKNYFVSTLDSEMKGLTTTADDSYLLYFNNKILYKSPAYFSSKSFPKQAEKIYEFPINPERIVWSEERSKVVIFEAQRGILYDLISGQATELQDIYSLGFKDENNLIIQKISDKKIWLRPISQAEQIIMELPEAYEEITISPDQKMIALTGPAGGQIRELSSGRIIKNIDGKINNLKWHNAELLAYVKGKNLILDQLNEDKISDLGPLKNNLYDWLGNNLVYWSDDKYEPTLTQYFVAEKQSKEIYKADIVDKPRFFLTVDNFAVINLAKNLMAINIGE